MAQLEAGDQLHQAMRLLAQAVGGSGALFHQGCVLLGAGFDVRHRLAHLHHVPVLCYGLRSDFRGDGFPGAVALLTLADELEEMKTICACARKASMNLRVDAEGRRVKEGEQIMIGGNESYRAVCPSCFYSDGDDPARAPGLFG